MARRKTKKKEETIKNENDFDLTEHVLVPKHEIISEKEEKKILKEFNIKIDQLPKILNTDPIAVSIGAKSGQVIRIERESQTAKKAVAYRIVVETTN